MTGGACLHAQQTTCGAASGWQRRAGDRHCGSKRLIRDQNHYPRLARSRPMLDRQGGRRSLWWRLATTTLWPCDAGAGAVHPISPGV